MLELFDHCSVLAPWREMLKQEAAAQEARDTYAASHRDTDTADETSDDDRSSCDGKRQCC